MPVETGRRMPAASQLDSPVSARVSSWRRSRRAARITTRNETLNTDVASTFQRIVHSMRPMPMPAQNAAVSEWKRASTAAASPGRIVVMPTMPSGMTPVNGTLVR